jgi:hypothetical protein
MQGDWVVACLKGAWPRLVGEKLATVCRPAAFKQSVLTIEITDEAWEKAIISVKRDLRDKLQSATAGTVKTLWMDCRGTGHMVT